MSVELASAYVSIIPTTKGIGAQLEKELGQPVADAAKKAGDTASKSLAQTGQQFTKLGVGALAVAGAIGAGLYKTGKSASDLNESVNAVQVTFGKAASGILKLGENAAHSMGLSNTAFNGLAVQFSAFSTTIAGKGGDVVATLQSITQRAADFASVMNIDVADAAVIFQSALAGETEPIRRFGIDMSMATVNAFAYANGIADVGTQLTEGEKVQARYALLMQATAKNQGDFANTSDSAANSMRIAKAEAENAAASLGAVVAPAMAFAATKAADLVKGFVSLNDASGGLLVKGVAVVGGLAGVAGAFSVVAGQVIKFKGFITNSAGELNNFGKAAKGVGIAIGAVGLAIAGLEVLNKLTEDSQKAADGMNSFVVEMHKIRGGANETAGSVNALLDLTDKILDSKGLTSQAWLGLTHGVDFTGQRLDILRQTIKKIGDTSPQDLQQLIDALGATQGEAELGDKSAQKLLKTWGLTPAVIAQLSSSTTTAAEAQKILTAATGEGTSATGISVAAQEELDKALKATADELQKSADSLNNQVSAMRGAADATYAEADATDALTKFNAELSKKLKDAKGDHDAINAVLREGTKLAAVHADAVVRIGVEHATATGTVFDATQKQDAWNREMLYSAMNAVPAERDAILKYIADANNIPQSKTTDIEALIVQGRFEEAAAQLAGLSAARKATVEADAETVEAKKDLDKLTADRTVKITPVLNAYKTTFPQVPSFNVPYPQNAAGTPSWKGGLTWLAENGPELVNLPRGTAIHSATETRQMLAGLGDLEPRSASGGPLIGTLVNNRRDVTVGDLNQVFAMARLRQ